MKSQYEHIIHPFPPLYDNNSKILILGSLPSVKSREQMFFYGHPQNRFWKVITAVINNSGMNDKNIEVPVTIEEKMMMLHNNHIALWDTIYSCDIIGSSDSSIKNVVPTDLGQIKGYALRDAKGEYFPFIRSDIDNGPDKASSAMAVVSALLYERFNTCKAPLAVVSMDNCSHNGEKLRNSITDMVGEWQKKGFVSEDFVQYVNDENTISFPWSMIDKITPRPADTVAESLKEAGVEDMDPVITSKRTYIAPFVNAEGPQYLVIEDRFPNGRPQLEKAGVYMTDRDTVNKVERMKVTTCLNPLHTALAVYGCVLGYDLIADEMKDKELSELVKRIGLVEGMPVVTNPGIIDPEKFADEVINVRIPNPFMPDTPQRIATDTSQKVGIRYGETIKSYVAKDGSARALTAIPLAIAGWCRYLLGIDDNGEAFELSPDPMADELKCQLDGIVWGESSSYTGQLKNLLSNANIFGINLYEAGIGDKIEEMFVEEISGKGAIRETLKKYL